MRLMELYGGFDCGGEHGFVRFCFGRLSPLLTMISYQTIGLRKQVLGMMLH